MMSSIAMISRNDLRKTKSNLLSRLLFPPSKDVREMEKIVADLSTAIDFLKQEVSELKKSVAKDNRDLAFVTMETNKLMLRLDRKTID